MVQRSAPLAYPLDTDLTLPADELTDLLGGKGAGLVVMTRLGLPVPPGFTLTTDACRRYLDHGWDSDLDDAVRAGLADLERRVGRRLGSGRPPFLLSVRAGAAVSMPGMMQTVLRVGPPRGPSLDPAEEVCEAVRAVFDSWHSDLAAHFRRVEGISGLAGTAATVQAMAFGDLDDRSASGVAFTRDPSTGEPGLMGDVLFRAAGDRVVAGETRTDPLGRLRERLPDAWEELAEAGAQLERHFADMVDIEFAIESGRLWLVQVRAAKRSRHAALRVAVDMAEDPGFPIDRAEAIRRCTALLADPPRVDGDQLDDVDVVCTGLPASPGLATGVLCTEIDEAVERDAAGRRVVLVRPTTSPADVHGLSVACGLVTTRGGLVSHAAVVARSWGIPCIVGADELTIAADGVSGPGGPIARGTVATVDGTRGLLLRGDHATAGAPVPEVAVINRWIEEAQRGGS